VRGERIRGEVGEMKGNRWNSRGTSGNLKKINRILRKIKDLRGCWAPR